MKKVVVTIGAPPQPLPLPKLGFDFNIKERG
jgi:hypothetical protein